MVKIYSETCFILVTLQLFSVLNNGYAYDNSENFLGDPCKLKNNQEGICKEITKCKYGQRLIDMKKYSEIEHCYYLTGEPVVCCPKSKKFTEALCEGKKPIVDIDTNILNGIKAEVGEFPHQAALGYKRIENSLDFDCGGSLIADDIVITAAHCANRKDTMPVMVRLGRASLDLTDTDDYSEVQDIEIEKIVLHSSYSRRTRHNDIALIKLKRPITSSDFVAPICLSSRTVNASENLTITGFGRIDANTFKKSDWLLKGVVNEYDLTECKKLFKPLKTDIVDGQICALSKDGVDGCQGDSGGPMIYTEKGVPYLYGVISFGSGCGSKFPAIYTRVHKYLDWIEEEMFLLE